MTRPIEPGSGRKFLGPVYDELLEAATVIVTRTPRVDWSEVGLMLVHKSSAEVFAAAIANGGDAPGTGDIALKIVPLDALAARGVNYDHEVACLLCANDASVCVGIARPGLKPKKPTEPMVQPNADGGYDLSPAAVLVVMYYTNLDDLKPGRARFDMARFQDRCRSLLAASPPDVELADVLWRHFGPDFDADIKALGFERAVDRLYARCGAAS
jgi:hypothetical protein